MATTTSAPPDCEVRAVIRFLTLENVSGAEIYRRLCAVYGNANVMKCRSVYEWVARFKEGCTNTHDEPREGRPRASINDETINIVRSLLADDWHLTVTDIHHEIATQFSYAAICRTSIHTILSKQLEMTKVSARWVPRMLTEEHRQHRVQSASSFLARYEAEGDAFLDRIVTGDEA